ncbi:MAG: 50S ribosomal protein L10 [Calditrichaeota bacterium]|nr:50S ribosomal protein L10 [Candidatus Cloacimonadota bacterium]MCB1048071.1 50S ribosomal protein L10 [Calditrichota bacterium]MCB9472420.1 50S ribosomal protein L10 [Candidatus Delongbacteria bacterium]
MPTPQKIAVVKEVSEKLQRSSVVYVTGYSGLNVAALTELRNDLRQVDAEYQIVKNNLVRLALESTPWADAGKELEGATALTFGYGDAAGPAKVLRKFAKFHGEKPGIKKIGFESSVYGGEYIGTLASMPTRPEALAMLAGVFNAFPASLARAFQALADKMAAEGGSLSSTGPAATEAPAPAETAAAPEEPAASADGDN